MNKLLKEPKLSGKTYAGLKPYPTNKGWCVKVKGKEEILVSVSGLKDMLEAEGVEVVETPVVEEAPAEVTEEETAPEPVVEEPVVEEKVEETPAKKPRKPRKAKAKVDADAK